MLPAQPDHPPLQPLLGPVRTVVGDRGPVVKPRLALGLEARPPAVRGRARHAHLVRDVRDRTALLDPADQREAALDGQTCVPMLCHEEVSCGRWLRTPRFHTETSSPFKPAYTTLRDRTPSIQRRR